MKLTELISALNILDSRGEMEADISEIIVDSRKSGPGRMFVCIDGYTTDGHRFIGDAVKNGISALLVTKMPPRDLIGDIPAVQVADTRLALAQVSDKLHSHPSGRLNYKGEDNDLLHAAGYLYSSSGQNRINWYHSEYDWGGGSAYGQNHTGGQ